MLGAVTVEVNSLSSCLRIYMWITNSDQLGNSAFLSNIVSFQVSKTRYGFFQGRKDLEDMKTSLCVGICPILNS